MIWILVAALIAGLVRGFSGFGTAMVFLPVASQYLTPFEAIASLAIMEFLGTFAVMRKSWGDAGQQWLFVALRKAIRYKFGMLMEYSLSPRPTLFFLFFS